jgi:hypothetical protein
MIRSIISSVSTFLCLFRHNSVIYYFRFLETKAFHRKPAKQIHHVIMRHNEPSSSNILSSFFACNNEQNKWKIFLKVKVKEVIDYNFALKLQILAQDCFVYSNGTALFNWLYQVECYQWGEEQNFENLKKSKRVKEIQIWRRFSNHSTQLTLEVLIRHHAVFIIRYT